MHRRILIATSDREALDVYRRFFCGTGCRVDVASDGITCLEKLRQSPPDTLIIENMLPWGGAAGVLAELRRTSSLDGIYVVVLTKDMSLDISQDLAEGLILHTLAPPHRLHRLLCCMQGVASRQSRPATRPRQKV